jgi:hypothetical protein
MADVFTSARLELLEDADPKTLKVFYEALKYQQGRKDRLVRDNNKALNAARMLAERTNTATARDIYKQYLAAYGLPAQIKRAEARATKYAREVGKLKTGREKLKGEREALGKLGRTEQEALGSAQLVADPREWVVDNFGAGGLLGEKEGTSKFVGDKSPGMYRALQVASGQSEDYFSDMFDDMGVDVDELYELYRKQPDKYDDRIAEIAAEAYKAHGGELKTFASSQDRSFAHDVITTYFEPAMRSYINSEVLTGAIDNELSALNDTIGYFEDGGALADYASVEVMTEGYNKMVEGVAATHFDGNEEAAREFIDGSLFKAGLPSTDTMDKAQALSSVDPSLLENASDMTEQERSLMLSRMVNQAVGSRTDPGASMIGQLFKDLETFNQDSAFATWRESNGIVATAPPGLAEFQRYNRQVKRVGSGLYRTKRTGDVREVTVVDERYAIPTRTAGIMSFTADGEYLTGKELEEMSAEQLKDSRYVEIDLSEDEVRERVFGSVATPAMREELLQFGKTKGFKDRARMVYDKKEGNFVILGDDLTVAYTGQVENPSALLTDVNDSRFAEPAGSARGFQANKAQNRLDDAEFKAMMALEDGAQATQLAGYLPAQRAKVAQKTFMGELTYIPGQDAATFSYLLVGPDGRRETRTYDVQDLISDPKVTNDEAGFARYRKMTGATGDATPREERQFNRMFRPPLLGKGRQYRKMDRGSRRARVNAGDVTSEVETYQEDDFGPREPVVAAPEVPEETPKDEGKAKKPGGKGPVTGGIKPGPEGAALRAGAGAGTGVGDDILPTPRKLVMDAVSGSGAAPYFEPSVDVGQIGRTVPPFEDPSPSLSDLEAAGVLEDGTPPSMLLDPEQVMFDPEQVMSVPPAHRQSKAAPTQLDSSRRKSAEAGRAVAEEVASAAIPAVPLVPGFGLAGLPLAAAGTGVRASAIDAAGDVGETAGGRLRDLGRAVDSSVPVIGEAPLTIRSPEGEALARIPSARDIGDTVSGVAADVVKGAIDYSPGLAARRALTDATMSVGTAAGESLADALKYLGGVEVDVGEAESRDEEDPEDERDEEEGNESTRRVAKR